MRVSQNHKKGHNRADCLFSDTCCKKAELPIEF